MIPNLNDLPHLLPEPERPIKRLLKPLLSLLAVLAVTGGLIWFYMGALKEAATEQEGLLSGLEAVGADLWQTGKAPEIRMVDPELAAAIVALQAAGELKPAVVVLPSEPIAGRPASTHEILYMKANRPLLAVQLWVDKEAGKVDIVAWQVLSEKTGPMPR